MDARVVELLRCGAPFGRDTLILGLPDEVVVSNVWPTIAVHLYLLSARTPETEVRDLVKRIMRLRVQSLQWKFTIDSSIEGMAVRATFYFAKLFFGADESWSHYFRRQF
jgi:hypothetical protein